MGLVGVPSPAASSLGTLQTFDAQLAALARVEAGLRLGLGQALEVLSHGGVFALGFSSCTAYALERCERNGRWVEAARCLARRLEPLPALRRALACGEVSWSMAELVARVAQPEAEAHWLEVAASHTVRQMRGLVRNALAAERAGNAPASAVSAGVSAAVSAEVSAGVSAAVSAAELANETGDGDNDGDNEELCTLICTVDREEAWLFEATRQLLEHLGERDSNAQLEALLAEGHTSLLAALPRGALDSDAWEQAGTQQQRRQEQLQRWRSEAELRCEEQVSKAIRNSRGTNSGATPGLSARGAPLASVAATGLASLQSKTPRELDESVRALAQALARHELELSQAALLFHRAGGWRRLGYATEAQYARERLGMSRSSLSARRSLASRLEALPRVAVALGTGQLGVEAAVQLVRIATARTQHAWVERAQRRTIKHLREDVVAALAAVRLSGEADCPPPAEGELAQFQELERAVLSGSACRVRTGPGAPRRTATEAATEAAATEAATEGAKPAGGPRYAWRVMLQSLRDWLDGGVQMSAARAQRARRGTASAGRVALRLRVLEATRAWWRGLEAQARGWLPPGMSWLKFLCLSLWKGWQHLLGADVGYGQIYLRDRYRCTSPVCQRQDVTPHHLKFRSAGGGDADDNVAAVCTWCHLFGIHGGSIRAEGTAQQIRWEIGVPGDPCLVVDGRERRAA